MANRRSICPQSDYSVVHLFADTAIGKKGAVVFYPMYLSRVCSRQQTSEEIANLIVISHITMMTRCFFSIYCATTREVQLFPSPTST
jgi:hypothetical protein